MFSGEFCEVSEKTFFTEHTLETASQVDISSPPPPPPPPLFYEDPPPIRYRLPLSFFQVFSEIVMKVHHPLLSMI